LKNPSKEKEGAARDIVKECNLECDRYALDVKNIKDGAKTRYASFFAAALCASAVYSDHYQRTISEVMDTDESLCDEVINYGVELCQQQ
jgi:hypothetical protein